MKSVISHKSHNSLDDFAQPYKVMFTDICLGRTKIGYMINSGLCPYYEDKFIKTLVQENTTCQKFVLCFDESLNNASTKKQLDVQIISSDENAKQIKRNYSGSQFRQCRESS